MSQSVCALCAGPAAFGLSPLSKQGTFACSSFNGRALVHHQRAAGHRASSSSIRAGEPTEKSLEVMQKFSEQYAKRTDTYFCSDLSVTAVVIKGLAEHKDTLGAPLCPCRHYDDKVLEAQQGFWNCPCVPMRERKECHCLLFLTEDNDFAGKEQKISVDMVKELTKDV
eukprot:TRINITY_DN17443_c0_g1_i1.p1 TRINITY_DN17443_c0_g1~~TRINITY_DN17443_c0_g1_i1.p1  ORF type:complete len:168 (+),score=12.72 TRINITY_DN17443_c0_g1_i1:180-683(+)